MISCWQAFTNARDSIQETFCYIRPVPMESNVTDDVNFVNCISQTPILFDSLGEGDGCFGEKKAELQNLPPSKAVFLEGVKCAPFQFIIWKSAPAINPDKPMPDSYGWKRDCDRYILVMTTLPPASEASLQLIKRGCSKFVCFTSRY